MMKDCNHKLISSSSIGNVMYCGISDELIIGIGTLILKFKKDQAKIFLKALKSTLEEYGQKANKLIDKIFLKTPVSNLMIALNRREMNESIELLEFAFLRLELAEIVPVN